MELRLYKEPYQEPFSENKVRLLFEGAIDADVEVQAPKDADNRISGRRDVYLYVWIENRRSLSGFQAVLDEEYVIDFHVPAKLDFSHIGGRPVKRSLSRPLTGRERREFCTFLSGLHNPVFPDLIKKVESIIHGEPVGSVVLTKDELQTLDKLASSSPGVPH
jgi:hypothetical protein